MCGALHSPLELKVKGNAYVSLNRNIYTIGVYIHGCFMHMYILVREGLGTRL